MTLSGLQALKPDMSGAVMGQRIIIWLLGPSLILAMGVCSPCFAQAEQQIAPLGMAQLGDKVFASDPAWSPPSLPRGARPAEPVEPTANWINLELDYPREALTARTEGTTTIGLAISSSGDLNDCQIVESSGDWYLDQGSCAVTMARGRYHPASATDGQPLASGTTLQINWHLDWSYPKAPVASMIRLTARIKADGSFQNCWVDHGDRTAASPHPEMCRGAWPPALMNELRRLTGQSEFRLVNISGVALTNADMAAQMAQSPNLQLAFGGAAWITLNEQSEQVGCEELPFLGANESLQSGVCGLQKNFQLTVERKERPVPLRIGRNTAWYVERDDQ